MHELSSAKGSRLSANDVKSNVKLLTIALLSLGVIAASLFAYQQFTKPVTPNLISKDEAIQIALTTGSWNEQTLRDKTIDATLLHIRENRFSFIVDQNTLQDTITMGGKFTELPPEYENRYIWEIGITAPEPSRRGWGYTIDAATGELVVSLP